MTTPEEMREMGETEKSIQYLADNDAKRRAVDLLAAEFEAHNWHTTADAVRKNPNRSMNGHAIAVVVIERLLLRLDAEQAK